jgi:RHS repeat-associated protein
MVEQNRSGTYTQFLYSPTGFKMSIMNGQAGQKSFVPLPAGAMAVYTNGFNYVHADWLGSPRLGSTTSRTTCFDVAYAPFGETYASSGSTDPAFTSQRQDTVSGLYDFPAREYSIQGRWPSPDPAGLAAVDPSNPQSWNRYAYVRNNPLNRIDPTGMNDCEEHADCENIFYGTGDFGQPGEDILGAACCVMDTTVIVDNLIGNTIADVMALDAGAGFVFTVQQSTSSFAPDTISVADMLNGSWGPSNGGGRGNSSGTPQQPKVSAQPTLKFKPPSWQNFTHEFLPCYGAELYNNFLGTDDQTWVTVGTVALTVKSPWIGGPLLVVWTGINAFKAGSACAVASRGYYQ